MKTTIRLHCRLHLPSSILQFNTNGLISSFNELASFLHKHKILIACIQETKLSKSSILKPFPNYSTIRKDRPSGQGGGIAFLIHHSLNYTRLNLSHLQNDHVLEVDGIRVCLNGSPTDILNVYIPPPSSCPPGYSPDFTRLFQQTNDCLILGDFNAHNPSWYSSTSCISSKIRGDALLDAINDSQLNILNEDSSTRLPTYGPKSSPDISICSAHLSTVLNWYPLTTLNSDHLPILVSFPDNDKRHPRRIKTYFNFKKADWDSFTTESEQLFSSLPNPTSCESGELS